VCNTSGASTWEPPHFTLDIVGKATRRRFRLDAVEPDQHLEVVSDAKKNCCELDSVWFWSDLSPHQSSDQTEWSFQSTHFPWLRGNAESFSGVKTVWDESVRVSNSIDQRLHPGRIFRCMSHFELDSIWFQFDLGSPQSSDQTECGFQSTPFLWTLCDRRLSFLSL